MGDVKLQPPTAAIKRPAESLRIFLIEENSPSHPILVQTRAFAVYCVYMSPYCMFDLSVYYLFRQYFDTVDLQKPSPI